MLGKRLLKKDLYTRLYTKNKITLWNPKSGSISNYSSDSGWKKTLIEICKGRDNIGKHDLISSSPHSYSLINPTTNISYLSIFLHLSFHHQTGHSWTTYQFPNFFFFSYSKAYFISLSAANVDLLTMFEHLLWAIYYLCLRL